MNVYNASSLISFLKLRSILHLTFHLLAIPCNAQRIFEAIEALTPSAFSIPVEEQHDRK